MNDTLVTGVTGLVGGEISKRLLANGVPHRVLVRDPSRYEKPGALVEVSAGSFEDSASLANAMSGISKIFLASFDRPEVVDLQSNLLHVAKSKGVNHVVRMSTICVEQWRHLPIFEWHGQCEKQLEESGLNFTHLRPSFVMQNFLSLVKNDVIRLPAADGHSGFVDVRDIAAVAAEALTKPGHENVAYALSSEVLRHQQIAEFLAEAIGRPVRFEDISLDTYRKEIKSAGWSQTGIETMVGLYSDIRADNSCDAVVTKTVERVLGCASLKFSDFARDYASCFEQRQ